MEAYGMAGHLIRRLNQISTQVFVSRTREAGYDITPVQFAAMDAVYNYPSIDQAGVASLIAYDRPTIGGVINRLIAKGFMQRSVSLKDRRSKILQLSESGLQIFNELLPIVKSFQHEILTGLSDEERVLMMNLVRKVISNNRSVENCIDVVDNLD